MAINVARVRHDGRVAWGVVQGERIARLPGDYPTTRDFMLEGAARARQGEAGADAVALADVQVLCPITTERQFICQAVNYHSHMREMGMDTKGSPFNIFFRKASSCLAPADTDIVLPAHVELLDYELELGLVFSRDVSGPIDVTPEGLHEVVGASHYYMGPEGREHLAEAVGVVTDFLADHL